MNYPRVIIVLLVMTPHSLNATSPTGNGSTINLVDPTVQAIASRAEALFSATFDFEVRQLDTNNATERYRFAVSGNEWSLRYADSQNAIVCTDDATLRYYESKTSAGEPCYSLHLTAPESLASAVGSNYLFAVNRLGTFWYRSQVEFIVSQSAQRLPDKEIHGQHTIGLRWPVSLADVDDAFVVMPNSITADFAGYLRVYAAPKLGFALLQIDYINAKGQLLCRYESRDFIEVDHQLFFPTVSRCTTFEDSEASSFEFHVSSIKHANQDIPDDEFDIVIASNARVRDSRPGFTQAAFRLSEQADISEIQKRLKKPDTSRPTWATVRNLLFAVNALLAMLFSSLWIRKRCVGKS